MKLPPLSPRPADGVWDWTRRYFDVGDHVRVVPLRGEPWTGTVMAVKVGRRYPRVDYVVEGGGRSPEPLLLEELSGWYEATDHAWRRWQMSRYLAGQFTHQLVFPGARVLRTLAAKDRPPKP